ncbi:hypothetical protein HDU91_004388 [Kappamyces sp. JEL0680]|nr:hypothetical protein HDU91_004388 [Kappamyces sp. JEL0680]
MLLKAALMQDWPTYLAILDTQDPKVAKALGRSVKPFDETLWKAHLDQVAFHTLLCKFTSTRQLQGILLATDDAVIVEASIDDRIWGIGLSVSSKFLSNSKNWKGKNVLGQGLMRVREHLRAQETLADDWFAE